REKGHEGCVLGVDTWPKGGLAVSCGLDKTVRVWEREPEMEAENAEDEADGMVKEEDGAMKAEEVKSERLENL
ncbi:MAG: hypothetical protein Q9181_000489, partial [Wetmoreana brouardii]